MKVRIGSNIIKDSEDCHKMESVLLPHVSVGCAQDLHSGQLMTFPFSFTQLSAHLSNTVCLSIMLCGMSVSFIITFCPSVLQLNNSFTPFRLKFIRCAQF